MTIGVKLDGFQSFFPLRRVGVGVMIHRLRGKERQGAHRLDLGFDVHEQATNVGMRQNRNRRRILGADVTGLHALLGILQGSLEGSIGGRIRLDTHREARHVHHDEHVFESLVLLADEVSDGAAARLTVIERARRRGMDAQLVLDPAAPDIVARAERSVRIDQELGRDEK